MSATFQVDTDRITGASADISRISGEIETQVASMMSRLTSLQDAWQGSAAAQFHGVVQQWQGTQRTVQQSLDSIASVLRTAGLRYAETEAEATRMFAH
ncbi:MAG: WXG100 family type VII secretion target [Nostocoides sp.]